MRTAYKQFVDAIVRPDTLSPATRRLYGVTSTATREALLVLYIKGVS